MQVVVELKDSTNEIAYHYQGTMRPNLFCLVVFPRQLTKVDRFATKYIFFLVPKGTSLALTQSV